MKYTQTLIPVSDNLVEKTPVLDVEAPPNSRGVFDSISDQLSLFPESQVDFIFVILALDVWYVDGDQDIRRLLLKAHQGQNQRSEVGCRFSLGPPVMFRGLRCDQGVCRDVAVEREYD